MANVAVDENSLKAIGDALREKLGSKRTLTEKEYKNYQAVRYFYSPGAACHGSYLTTGRIENQTFKWEGAAYLFIKISYLFRGDSGTFKVTNSSGKSVVSQAISMSYPGHEVTEATYTINGDTLNVIVTGAEGFTGAYFIEVTAADGNFVYLNDEYEYDVPVGEEENAFYPAEMADAIRHVQNNADWKMATVADTSADNTIREFDFSTFGIDFEKDNFWVLEFTAYVFEYGSSGISGTGGSTMNEMTVRMSPMTFFGGSEKGRFYYAHYGDGNGLDTLDNPYSWYKPSYDGSEERTGYVELFNDKLRIHSRGINPKSKTLSGWADFRDYNETVTLYYLGNKEV